MSFRHLRLFSTLLVITPACRPRATVPQPEPTYRVLLSEDGRLSVTATAVSASRILDQLRNDYGIVVEIPDFRDTTVTDRFVGLAVDSAIRRLVPGAHPHIVVVGRDRVLAADTGDKRGRRTVRTVGLPRKDTVPVFRLDDSLGTKAKPDTTLRRSRPSGVEVKGDPVDTAQPVRVESKRPSQPPQDTTRHLWLSLSITADGRLSVEAARVLEGPRVVSPEPEGPYYYVVTVGARPVAVGSFTDPFEIRAYSPDPQAPHRVARADTGRIVVTAPWEALASAEPVEIGLRIMRLRPGTEPAAVDLDRAAALMRLLEPVAALEPGALREPLERARRPNE